MKTEIKCTRTSCLYNADGECLNIDIYEQHKDSVYVLLDKSTCNDCNKYEHE